LFPENVKNGHKGIRKRQRIQYKKMLRYVKYGGSCLSSQLCGRYMRYSRVEAGLAKA
jgi:hypothetical protein